MAHLRSTRSLRWVLSSQATDKSSIRLASLAHGVVARVEVLALLEFVAEEVFLVWQLAIQAEELLLFL